MKGQLVGLELRHRRARCEDRIRCAKDTGLRNLPSLKGFAQNQLWCEIAALACEHPKSTISRTGQTTTPDTRKIEANLSEPDHGCGRVTHAYSHL